MKCRLPGDYIVKYFDGLLSEPDVAKMKKHLMRCRSCAEKYAFMKAALAQADCIHPAVPPEGFEAKVMDKVGRLEKSRNRRAALLSAIAYNAAVGGSVMLLLFFTGAFNPAGQGSFFQALLEAYRWLVTGTAILRNLVNLLFKIIGILLEEYYFIIMGIAALALTARKFLFRYSGRTGGSAV